MVLSCGHLAGFTDPLESCRFTKTKNSSFPDEHCSKAWGWHPCSSVRHLSMGSSFLFGSPQSLPNQIPAFAFTDVRLTPHYPAKSPLADILRLVAPGSDEYVTEKYAFEIESLLKQWSQTLRTSARDLSTLAKLAGSFNRSLLADSRQGILAAFRIRNRHREKTIWRRCGSRT